MSNDRNWAEGKGNPQDWSTEGWTAEWRRIGLEWWQFRVFDPNGEIRTDGKNGWTDYRNAFYSNLMNAIKREIQHYASIDAINVAEVKLLSFDEIVVEARPRQ